LGQRYLFFKIFCLILILFCLVSCAKEENLNKSPNLTKAEEAHLLNLRSLLATSKEFYAELSIRDKEIRICHSGVTLKSYPFRKAEMETRHFFFIRVDEKIKWTNKIFVSGKLFPERIINRIKIIPGDETTRPTPDQPGIVPPTMEEIIAVPPQYELFFKEGLSIKFNLVGKIPGKVVEKSKEHSFMNDLLIGAGFKKGPKLRIEIEIDANPGAQFFRSVPENTKLLILP